jgi:quinol-cytochrome oxidoreductase complex cytochrome b subunit
MKKTIKKIIKRWNDMTDLDYFQQWMVEDLVAVLLVLGTLSILLCSSPAFQKAREEAKALAQSSTTQTNAPVPTK